MEPMAQPLDEKAIRARAGSKVFARGERYCRSGAVLALTRCGSELHAQVAGDDEEPYRVVIRWPLPEGAVKAECSCPYAEEWEGWCKHIVAVLLAYSAAASVVEQKPLEDLLAPLDRLALQRLVLALARDSTTLYGAIARWLQKDNG